MESIMRYFHTQEDRIALVNQANMPNRIFDSTCETGAF